MLKQYLYLGAALAALVAVGTIAYQHRVINGLEADNAVLKGQVQDKDATIDAQSHGIAEMIKAATASEAALKAAGDTIDTYNALLAAERAKRNAKVEKDYALPDCAALLATDLAAVCPAHAQRLRDAATNR